jgi:hypothetical protein
MMAHGHREWEGGKERGSLFFFTGLFDASFSDKDREHLLVLFFLSHWTCNNLNFLLSFLLFPIILN